MRIDPSFQYLGNTGTENVNNAKGPKANPPESGPSGASDPNAADAGDTVQFSGTLSDMQQLKAQLAETPDIRSSRVAALQQQVQQGTYQPSNEQIANAMMSDLFGSGS